MNKANRILFVMPIPPTHNTQIHLRKTSKELESISAGSHEKNEGKRQGPQIAYVAFRPLQMSQRTSKEICFIQSC